MQTEDLDFGLLCNLTGQIGFSCDLASFSPENQDRIARYIAFYKEHRESFLRSEAYLLTPPEDIEKRRGWVALQLSDPKTDTHFLYAFHCICDGDEKRVFHPQGLDATRQYEVLEMFPERHPLEEKVNGETLIRSGLLIEFPKNDHLAWRGKLLIVRRAEP